jgi:hypothetical protein
MDVLSKVDTRNVVAVLGVGAGGMPLATTPAVRGAHAAARSVRPATRDGFFLVPRLATHGGAARMATATRTRGVDA